jgi:transposase-like protein
MPSGRQWTPQERGAILAESFTGKRPAKIIKDWGIPDAVLRSWVQETSSRSKHVTRVGPILANREAAEIDIGAEVVRLVFDASTLSSHEMNLLPEWMQPRRGRSNPRHNMLALASRPRQSSGSA